MLLDNHGRKINYLRLAVTDRCNLRCFYCMPESGIQYVNRKDLLSFEEMSRMIRVFSEMGITKLRITGGEPFLRKGIMEFLENVSGLDGLEEIHITTNGTFTHEYIPRLEKMGVKSVNLSLDSVDKERFKEITRRDKFDQVMETYQALLDSSIKVKINAVVMEGRNIEDIYPIMELAKEDDVAVRFIEEMPFNGTKGQGNATFWPMKKILSHIQEKYEVEKLEDPPFSTSMNYQIPGFKGTFGIIAAYTRTFCGTCNRIRVTPQGQLKTCLYDDGVMSIRDLIRTTDSDEELQQALLKALGNRAKDGFEAEERRSSVSESMATIGG
ncbi:MAG: GTP 3',8-cyclase MoaA [Cyclobacteriaceae bacterium]